MPKIKLIALLGILVIHQSSCANERTPKKYINRNTVSGKVYERNKQELVDSIRRFILINSSAYYSKNNDSLTKIFIDTILYSPSKDRIAFFVITQNSNTKFDSSYYYDAHCFVGYLDSSYNVDRINWVSAYNLLNYRDYKETSERIREIYFNEFKREGTLMEYNLNDMRFWNSSFWREIEKGEVETKTR